MNVALVSILTNGCDLTADVGAISLTVNDRVNVWIMNDRHFLGNAHKFQASQPQQTQYRIEALAGLEKEGWPKVKMSTALNDINELIREVGTPIVMWDFDPVSFIDAHAFLWTNYPDCRPAIRRVEGDWGNMFLSGLACLKGAAQGFVEYNGFYSLNGRATKAHSLIYRYLDAVMPDSEWKNAPKINMRDIKDRASETLAAGPDLPPLNLGAPVAPPAGLTLPPKAPPALKLPGM